MRITADRAFWILEYYRSRQTVLAFGGRILNEDATCEIMISHVWSEIQSMGVKLLSADGKKSWDRIVPLQHARFNLLQMGDPEFEQFANPHLHSILIVNFIDGTTMFLAEQTPALSVPQTCPDGAV